MQNSRHLYLSASLNTKGCRRAQCMPESNGVRFLRSSTTTTIREGYHEVEDHRCIRPPLLSAVFPVLSPETRLSLIILSVVNRDKRLIGSDKNAASSGETQVAVPSKSHTSIKKLVSQLAPVGCSHAGQDVSHKPVPCADGSCIYRGHPALHLFSESGTPWHPTCNHQLLFYSLS